MDTRANQIQTSSALHPSTFFAPSLQYLIFEKLLKEKGSIKNLLYSIKANQTLSELKKEAIKIALRPQLHVLLLQATIDDNRNTVRAIVDDEPELILYRPPVHEIESQLTFQKFRTESAFLMAQKLKRLEITRIMLPYFEQMLSAAKANKSKEDLIQYWLLQPPLSKEEQKQADEELQDEYIETYLESMIDTIAADPCENGLVNAETEAVLEAFRKIVLPDEAIRIDKYFDIEQLLIASYKAYDESFDIFQNDDQRGIFSKCVIGFIQSVASPKLAQAYCEGLDNAENVRKNISLRTSNLQLEDGTSFYNPSRTSRSGLGFDHFCISGRHHSSRLPRRFPIINMPWPLEIYVNRERQSLASLCNEFTQMHSYCNSSAR